jgi:hypothetical protein
MKEKIGPYTFELTGSLVSVTESATGELLKAIDYRPHEAVDKFNNICAHWRSKMKVKVA